MEELRHNDGKSKILFVLGACGFCVLMGAFVLTWFNIVDLKIVNEMTFSVWIEYILNVIMFMINMFFVFSISLCVFDKSIIRILIGYTPVIILSLITITNSNLIYSAYIPFAYVLICAIYKYRNKFYNSIIRYGSFGIIIGLYQQLSNYIKFNVIGISYHKCNVSEMFIYSIDLYLVYIFSYKVVKKYYARFSREMVVRWIGILKDFCKEILISQQIKDVSDLTPRQRNVFYFAVWIYLVLQSFFVIGTNVLVNKFLYYLDGFYIGAIELVIAWVALELCRLALGKTYHNKNPLICNAVSLSVFFIISRFSLPLYISLFFNICVAAIIAFIIHKFVVGKEQYDDMADYLHKCNIPVPFRCSTATESELRERGLSHGLKDEDIDFIVRAYRTKTTRKEFAAEMNLSESTIKNKKKFLTKILESQEPQS